MQMLSLKSSQTEGAYARRFEYRPELLFGSVVRRVIDADVREREIGEYTTARVEDVFSGCAETFLVFGKPNTALVVPKTDCDGYQKFAAYSVWRKAAEIADITRDSGSIVQSGIWIRLVDPPAEAIVGLRKGMQKFQGRKFRTCVNGTMRVMSAAGFTSGGKRLASITFPHQLMTTLLAHGLCYKGTPVQFEVIRTTRYSMEDYMRHVIFAGFTAPWRHFKKLPVVSRIVDAIPKFRSRVPYKREQIAPALPHNRPYCKDIRIRVTAAPAAGQALRQLWGPHALFEGLVDRVNVDEYFARALRPFPQKNPSISTILKKNLLFSRPVIWLIRKILGASTYHEIATVSERDIYDMLRTQAGSRNKYNMVVVRSPPLSPGNNPTVRVIIARITVGSKLVDWVLSKHVLMSGYLWSPYGDCEVDKTQQYVVWAGECWKDADGIIRLSGNSGTYQPKSEEDESMVALGKAIFPNLRIEKAP